jgi:hypothetical protein
MLDQVKILYHNVGTGGISYGQQTIITLLTVLYQMKNYSITKCTVSSMKRIQHNGFKMYTTAGLPANLTTLCQQHPIYKTPAYDFYKYICIAALEYFGHTYKIKVFR